MLLYINFQKFILRNYRVRGGGGLRGKRAPSRVRALTGDPQYGTHISISHTAIANPNHCTEACLRAPYLHRA